MQRRPQCMSIPVLLAGKFGRSSDDSSRWHMLLVSRCAKEICTISALNDAAQELLAIFDQRERVSNIAPMWAGMGVSNASFAASLSNIVRRR